MANPSKIFCEWAADRNISGFQEGIMPEKDLIDKAAARLVNDIREGIVPDSSQIEELIVWFPFLENVRKQIIAQDKQLIISLLQDKNTQPFGVLLSRGILHDDDITVSLKKLFQTAEDPNVKLGLFHALSARKINDETRSQLSDFVADNLHLFVDESARYSSLAKSVIDVCRQRMDDPEYKEKRWYYLFMAHGESRSEEVKILLNEYINDSDSFIAQTAKKSLEIFEKKLSQ